MTDVAILVPRRADHGPRDRLWTFARARWAELFPEWPIVEGHHERGPFNRSAAVNRAAELAGDWRVALVIDSDVIPDPTAVRRAVEIAELGRPAIAFTHRKHLTKKGSEEVLRGLRGSWEPHVKVDLESSVSGAYAVPRPVWDRIRGFDELFVGWGCEDVAFHLAVELAAGTSTARTDGDLWHLWHPVSPERDKSSPLFEENRARRRRYEEAFETGSLELLDELTVEDVASRDPRLLELELDPSKRIPPFLHRTVPEETSTEVERWWARARELHPRWTLFDWSEPLDPEDWPETGDLWPLCRSGAQRAGLIRLEALYRLGGIYLDSDVEPYRPLDPLLALEGFAAWEDERTVPDAVLGFRRGHPAVAVMLERARRALEDGSGAWDSGPGVSTEVLPGRSDVLLLPPGSFFPYHYRERHRRDEDHGRAPWVFAAHHWAHSWRGR